MKEGPANQSYGLQVAALAGVPPAVIKAARKYLQELERHSATTHAPALQQQLALAMPIETEEHAAVQCLRELNPDAMTPREAMEALYKLKAMAK